MGKFHVRCCSTTGILEYGGPEVGTCPGGGGGGRVSTVMEVLRHIPTGSYQRSDHHSRSRNRLIGTCTFITDAPQRWQICSCIGGGNCRCHGDGARDKAERGPRNSPIPPCSITCSCLLDVRATVPDLQPSQNHHGDRALASVLKQARGPSTFSTEG